MDFTYDLTLVALSIATAMLGAFTALVVTSGIGQPHISNTSLRVLLAAAGIGSGLWATHFISLEALLLPVSPEFDRSSVALSAAIMVITSALTFAFVIGCGLNRLSFLLACIVFTAGMAAMHHFGLTALANNYGLDYSDLGCLFALAIGVQTSATIFWFSFQNRALLDTFLAAAALGLAISASNYSALEAMTLYPPSGVAPAQVGPKVDYALALSAAGGIYAICSFCIAVFALISSLGKDATSGRHGASVSLN